MLPDLPIEEVIVQFTLVVAAALSIQLVLARSVVPVMIGLLVLGIVAGPGGFGVLAPEPVVELLGAVGLLYIMFIAGLEIDLEMVRRRRGEAVGFGALAFALTFVPAVAAGLLLGLETAGAILLGAALSSHTLVSYPTLVRLGLVGRRPIVAATGGTLLTDTAALLVLAVVIQNPAKGSGFGWILPLLLLAGLAVAALVVVPRVSRLVLAQERYTLAQKALFLLATLLVLAVLADWIGTESILGAFIAGLCLNRALRERQELREHVEFVGRMLFIPFFFVETGMRVELAVLLGEPRIWLQAGLLVAAIILGKGAAAWLTGRFFGYRPVARLAMAGLSLPQAAATLAVIVTARELDLVGVETVDAVIIVIFVTCLVGPLVTNAAAARMARNGGEEQDAETEAERRPPPGPGDR